MFIQPNYGLDHKTGKGRFSFQSQKGNAKEYSNHCTTALISHASKVMLKIPQARLQKYVDQQLPDVQAGFRRGRRTRDCQHPLGHRKSNVIPKNIPTSVSLTMLKPLTMWITTNCGKFLKRWEWQATLPTS